MNQEQKLELDKLAEEHDGLLKAETVVEFAKDPETALHKAFTWDDTEAAILHRLTEARQLVRVYVKMEPSINRTVRAFVSVPSDRINDGGYRKTSSVLANPSYRMQVLEEALNVIKGQSKRFSYLPELTPLFNKIDDLVDQYRQEIKAKAAG